MWLSKWTPSIAAWVESGRRRVTGVELLLLCYRLGCTPAELIEGVDSATVSEAGMIPLDKLRAVLSEPVAPNKLAPEGSGARDEERKAAKKLGLSVGNFRIAFQDIYGRRLVDERDARLGDTKGLDARSIQAKRGRVTREISAELANKYQVRSSGRGVTWDNPKKDRGESNESE